MFSINEEMVSQFYEIMNMPIIVHSFVPASDFD